MNIIISVVVTGILCFVFNNGTAQPDSSCHCAGMVKGNKGTMYVTGGYNLDWFSKSDIHFVDRTTDDYDFTLYNVKAEDFPGLDNLLHKDISIPQYSFRFGYWFNDKHNLGIEFNYDHVKYVVIQNQVVHMRGYLRGVYYDKDTQLVESFIRYEHTNGANYAMLNFMKRFSFLNSKNEQHWLSLVAKAGAGIVLPRSDTYVAGNHRNDTYHVAGYVVGVDAGLRYDFYRYFFLETTFKGCFANYNNVFLYGDGKASQKWWSLEYIFTFGFQWPVRKS